MKQAQGNHTMLPQGAALHGDARERTAFMQSHRTIVMLEARQDEQVASKYLGFDE